MYYRLILAMVFLTGCAHPASQKTQSKADAVADPSFSKRKIALSDDGFCQVRRDGRIRCRLMNFSPASIVDTPPDGRYTDVVSWERGFCALAESGAVDCWQNTRNTFNSSLQFDGSYTQLASTNSVVCALRVDGLLECAGEGGETSVQDPPPVPATVVSDTKYERVSGGHSICAISRTNRAHCYRPSMGEAREDGGGVVNTRHQKHRDVGTRYVKAVQTRLWSCGLTRDGRVHCKASLFPVYLAKDADVPPIKLAKLETFRHETFTDLIGGFGGVCARHIEGHWVCEDQVEPVDGTEQAVVVGNHDPRTAGITSDGKLVLPGGHTAPGRFVDIYSSAGYTCAIRHDDTVFCDDSFRPYDDYRLRGLSSLEGSEYYLKTPGGRVGLNRENDEKGDGRVHGRLDPRNEEKTGFVDVQHGNDFGCGLRADGRIDCWGSSGVSKSRITPPREQMQAIALGGVFGCAITRDKGEVRCWGGDYFGHQRHAPKGSGFVELRTTYLNTCAEKTSGAVICWGRAFSDTFEMPIQPQTYALTEAGVCGVDQAGDVTCWGVATVWN